MELEKVETASRSWKRWTEEDELYLEEKFGILSLNVIAKNLERSVSSVEDRKYSLQLGPSVEANENITAQELSRVLNISLHTILRYINNKGLPAKRKILYKKRLVWQINITRFWKWLEVNENIVMYKMEKNILGKEPAWVDERRRSQFRNKSEIKTYKFWTKSEIKYLAHNYKKKSLKEMSVYLKKDETSIKNKTKRLRLIKKVNLKWQDEEISILKEMISKSINHYEIAEELGRSVFSVKNKITDLKKKALING